MPSIAASATDIRYLCYRDATTANEWGRDITCVVSPAVAPAFGTIARATK
jgi:hypothetical protein